MSVPKESANTPSTFIHPHALVDEGVKIGARTRVWAFAHLATGAVVGADCNICDHTFIEGAVRVGDRVTVKCGVYLWDGVIVEDEVHIGPCVAFTNDLRHRSRRLTQFSSTLLRTGCSIGANSTLLPVTIGHYAMVGAGSVVTHDVPAHGLVYGNPARLRGWVCCCGLKLTQVRDSIFVCTCGKEFVANGESLIERGTQ